MIDWSLVLTDQSCPPVIFRSKWDKLAERFGLPFKGRSLANMDCDGRGIPGKEVIAGQVAYRRENVIEWLNGLQGAV